MALDPSMFGCWEIYPGSTFNTRVDDKGFALLRNTDCTQLAWDIRLIPGTPIEQKQDLSLYVRIDATALVTGCEFQYYNPGVDGCRAFLTENEVWLDPGLKFNPPGTSWDAPYEFFGDCHMRTPGVYEFTWIISGFTVWEGLRFTIWKDADTKPDYTQNTEAPDGTVLPIYLESIILEGTPCQGGGLTEFWASEVGTTEITDIC